MRSLGEVLPAPSPGQVEDLQSPGRNRERGGQLGQEVVLGAVVVQRLRDLEHAAGVKGQAGLQPEGGLLVRCVDEHPTLTAPVGDLLSDIVHFALDAGDGEQG